MIKNNGLKPWRWLLALSCAALFACAKKQVDTLPLSLANDDSAVLAKVEGTPITQAQLESAARRILGENAPAYSQTAVENRLLQSLIDSRAMAIVARKTLPADGAKDVEEKVIQYREELLAKLYLTQHVSPVPVTEAMVQDYYDKNADQFGGATIRKFEYWQSVGVLDATAHKRVIEWLEQNRQADDWQKLAEKARAEKLPLKWQQSESALQLLNEPLRSLVAKTQIGQQSELSRGEVIYAIKVTGERKQPPKALALVKDDIRKLLAPVQLKKAVKEAAQAARTQVRIEAKNDK